MSVSLQIKFSDFGPRLTSALFLFLSATQISRSEKLTWFHLEFGPPPFPHRDLTSASLERPCTTKGRAVIDCIMVVFFPLFLGGGDTDHHRVHPTEPFTATLQSSSLPLRTSPPSPFALSPPPTPLFFLFFFLERCDVHLGRVQPISHTPVLSSRNKALCSGLDRNEVGQSMQGTVCGGGTCPLSPPPPPPPPLLPHSLYLSISCPSAHTPPLPQDRPPLLLLALQHRRGDGEGGREGGNWFIQHRLNVFTAAQCRGGVGRCKAGRGTNGGKGRETERGREQQVDLQQTVIMKHH